MTQVWRIWKTQFLYIIVTVLIQYMVETWQQVENHKFQECITTSMKCSFSDFCYSRLNLSALCEGSSSYAVLITHVVYYYEQYIVQ